MKFGYCPLASLTGETVNEHGANLAVLFDNNLALKPLMHCLTDLVDCSWIRVCSL